MEKFRTEFTHLIKILVLAFQSAGFVGVDVFQDIFS